MKIKKVSLALPELVERFTDAFSEVSQYVVGRDAELSALKLCMLTRQHLLLEGKPGIAKSRFAILGFRVVHNARIFRKMLTGSTPEDAIFGPINPKLLREEGVLRHNTEGMLPTSDFAYLDELFKAPPLILDSLLNALNERVFTNGSVVEHLPLCAAVATTNHVTISDETEAFLDRFLIYRRTMPADSDAARDDILNAFLVQESVEDITLNNAILMSELRQLQNAVREVKVPPIFRDFLHRIRTAYTSACGKYVSDRRLCWAYRTLQAAIMLRSNGERLEDPSLDSLAVLADVLARVPDDIAGIENNLASLAGDFERECRETADFDAVSEAFKTVLKSYDPSMPPAKARKLNAKLSRVMAAMTATDPADQFTSPRYQEQLRALIRQGEELRLSLSSDFGLTPVKVTDDDSDDSAAAAPTAASNVSDDELINSLFNSKRKT